jgi:hypothetical protein
MRDTVIQRYRSRTVHEDDVDADIHHWFCTRLGADRCVKASRTDSTPNGYLHDRKTQQFRIAGTFIILRFTNVLRAAVVLVRPRAIAADDIASVVPLTHGAHVIVHVQMCVCRSISTVSSLNKGALLSLLRLLNAEVGVDEHRISALPAEPRVRPAARTAAAGRDGVGESKPRRFH